LILLSLAVLPKRRSMPKRRLDDLIRNICAQIADAPNDNVPPLLRELKAAIHEKICRIRSRAAHQLLYGRRYKERRILPP
jgi:hypothetical protein